MVHKFSVNQLSNVVRILVQFKNEHNRESNILNILRLTEHFQRNTFLPFSCEDDL